MEKWLLTLISAVLGLTVTLHALPRVSISYVAASHTAIEDMACQTEPISGGISLLYGVMRAGLGAARHRSLTPGGPR